MPVAYVTANVLTPKGEPASGQFTFTPIRVNESGSIVADGPSVRTNVVAGHLATTMLTGLWRVDSEILDDPFTFELTSAASQSSPLDLMTVVPYTPPVGATVTTLQVPVGGTDGQVLAKSGAGLVWVYASGAGGSTDWAAITNKPTTFAPIVGTTATTAKAGDWLPTWANVTGKPTEFTPSAHTHTGSDITSGVVKTVNNTSPDTNGNVTITVSAGSTDWASITNKPSTFAPIIGTTAGTAKAGEWLPLWTDVSGKPSTFTPSAHTHTAPDLSGVVKTVNGTAPDASGNVAVSGGSSGTQYTLQAGNGISIDENPVGTLTISSTAQAGSSFGAHVYTGSWSARTDATKPEVWIDPYGGAALPAQALAGDLWGQGGAATNVVKSSVPVAVATMQTSAWSFGGSPTVVSGGPWTLTGYAQTAKASSLAVSPSTTYTFSVYGTGGQFRIYTAWADSDGSTAYAESSYVSGTGLVQATFTTGAASALMWLNITGIDGGTANITRVSVTKANGA